MKRDDAANNGKKKEKEQHLLHDSSLRINLIIPISEFSTTQIAIEKL